MQTAPLARQVRGGGGDGGISWADETHKAPKEGGPLASSLGWPGRMGAVQLAERRRQLPSCASAAT